MRRTQLIAAAVFVALGLLALFVVIPHAVVDAPASSGLPPAFMPYVAASLVTLAALGWLASELRGARAASPAAGSAQTDARFVAAAAAVLAGSFLLMSAAGYLVGGAALVAGTLALARVRLATIVVAAIVAPAVLWLVFAVWLATPLP